MAWMLVGNGDVYATEIQHYDPSTSDEAKIQGRPVATVADQDPV